VTQAQNIIFCLDDGRKIYATVPVFMDEGELVKVVNIMVGKPYDLPEGCNWKIDHEPNSTD
jgi:hypothetical protein